MEFFSYGFSESLTPAISGSLAIGSRVLVEDGLKA